MDCYDIVKLILLELPVKSLVRFKSCCKSWRCSIDDAEFINSHMHKSCFDSSRQKFLLVSDNHPLGPRGFKMVSTEASISADSKVVRVEEPNNIPGGFFSSKYSCFEVFSCSGLVLMVAYRPLVIMTLWNPAVGKYKLIPNNSFLSLQKTHCLACPVFGIAYADGDYKVVCVHPYFKKKYDRLCSYLILVYSVKNQCWRRIHNINCPIPSKRYAPILDSDTVSLNGVMHRMCPKGLTIISFDLADEKFIVTPVPNTCEKHPELLALGDCLCVLATIGKEILIWSLEKDYKTWNCINKFPTLVSLIEMPLVVIGGVRCSLNYIICVKQNGKILWRKHEGTFIEYDVGKNEYIEFKNAQVPHFRVNKALYVESLVSLKIPWD